MTSLRASDFDFVLPQELIAQVPAERRDDARLLLLGPGRGPFGHHRFTDLPALIEQYVGPGALLVVNDTRVIPARLFGHKLHRDETTPAGKPGGKVELLLCEPAVTTTPAIAEHNSDGPGAGSWSETWRCLYQASKPLHPGAELALSGEGPPRCVVTSNEGGGKVIVRFTGTEVGGLIAALERIGVVPLPPYIRREVPSGASDREVRSTAVIDREVRSTAVIDRQRYQTVYAAHPGAVAAPTAGLHFTQEIFAALHARGIERVAVTLHVGPGTFAPLKSDDLSEHVMHGERYHVPTETAAAIGKAKAQGRKLIAVGTTVVRTLESATPPGAAAPLAGWGETRLFIHPPYRFRAVDALLTNFHLPRSTLLMLVAAFAGKERVLAAYAEAVQQRYRFFSYGDAMFIPMPGSAATEAA